jgi:hypothetical protein
MALWEVSIVFDTASRFVTARDVRQHDLERAVREAQERITLGTYIHPAWKTGAVAITRMDQTLEARRERWESEFYDVDRAGRRRRRFKRSQIEREWEAWVSAERKAERDAAKLSNDQYKQRR